MKTTEKLTIIPPEGMEAYQEGNEIKFRPIKKKLTYEDIAKELFANKDTWRIEYGNISKYSKTPNWQYLSNCASEKQAKKLHAINQLMNVAKYFNGDWQPSTNDSCYFLYLNAEDFSIEIGINRYSYVSCAYFKSEKLAEKAIEILGTETIRLALSTDY